MNKNKIFITYYKNTHYFFLDIIINTSLSIAETFSNDKAYTGPEPFDLKKAVKIDMLESKGIGFDAAL